MRPVRSQVLRFGHNSFYSRYLHGTETKIAQDRSEVIPPSRPSRLCSDWDEIRAGRTRGVSLEKISYTFAKISNKNLMEKSKNLIKIPKICKQF